jgi:hypothetical protein
MVIIGLLKFEKSLGGFVLGGGDFLLRLKINTKHDTPNRLSNNVMLKMVSMFYRL